MYRAVKSFCGKVSMGVGEVREIPDSSIADDLVKAGYVVEITDAKQEAAKPKRKVKRNDSCKSN